MKDLLMAFLSVSCLCLPFTLPVESGLSPEVYNYPKTPVYFFSGVKRAFFPAVELKKLNRVKSQDVYQDLKGTLPRSLVKRPQGVLTILETLLKESQKQNIDPFWALSIIWTESHFKVKARSQVGARGLMQLMPGTAQFIERSLAQKSKEGFEETDKDFFSDRDLERLWDVRYNIKLGVFYLSYLMDMFRGNYRLATVAYNMGPFWVKKRLRNQLPVGEKNLYWDKVIACYKRFTRGFIERTTSSGPGPFVARGKNQSNFSKAKDSYRALILASGFHTFLHPRDNYVHSDSNRGLYVLKSHSSASVPSLSLLSHLPSLQI